jgi:tRNA-dihydrouridine synthase C
VFANGDIWDVDDWRRCRAVCGVPDIMLGRGLVARPDLARQIAAANAGRDCTPMEWAGVRPLVEEFWLQARRKLGPGYAPGRIKQWLRALARNYPEAARLFADIRRETDCLRLDRLLGVTFMERLAA